MCPLSTFLEDSEHFGAPPMSPHFSANLQSACFFASSLHCSMISLSSFFSAAVSASSFTILTSLLAPLVAQVPEDNPPRFYGSKSAPNLSSRFALFYCSFKFFLIHHRANDFDPTWMTTRREMTYGHFEDEKWKCSKLYNLINLKRISTDSLSIFASYLSFELNR